MKKQLYLRIYGEVQGVNFRWFVRTKAVELGLVGWVRNSPDGTVEALAQGVEKNLLALKEKCEVGPTYARVDRVEADWQNADESFSLFEIL